MSFLRHVEACNRFDADRFLPLRLDDRRVGFVRRDRAAALADHPDLFWVEASAIAFAPGIAGPALTAALGEASAALVGRGLIPGLRGEMFAVSEHWGGKVLFEIDRGAVPFFGTRSYGVHLNGLCGDDLWIGIRAKDKKVAPGKLDNMVAGGISAGYDAFETLVKESAEEADMPENLARTARSAGAALYRMEVPEGLRDDVLFVYDIDLPEAFTPRNTDGEIASFRRMPIADCLSLVAETDEFKFNVNLVLTDLALRRGIIGPNHPEFLALVTGLRGGLVREAANLGG